MIAEIKNGRFIEHHSLLQALKLDTEREKLPRISAVGAGGKTSVLKRLASEYKKMGQKSIVTTTTHMLREDSPMFAQEPSLEEIMDILEREGCVFTGGEAGNGRIKALPSDLLEAVLALPYPVLIEADGAKMLPVKIPALHEPVILPQTTCVLSVYGLDAVGRSIQEICFRPELAARFLDKNPEDWLDSKDLALLAQGAEAGRKGVCEGMRYVVVLNKADSGKMCERALDIWKAMENRGDMQVIVTSLKGNQR